MQQLKKFSHEFVEFIPDRLDPGKVYVCIPFATVAHLCACGCGHEVVTPLTPTDWKLTFDGETISLQPSIGNWSFACQSHYWLQSNSVHWAGQWSKEEIAAGRMRDRSAKQLQYKMARRVDSRTDRQQTFMHSLVNAIRRILPRKK